MKKASLENYVESIKQGIEEGKKMQVAPLYKKVELLGIIGTEESLPFAECLQTVLAELITVPVLILSDSIFPVEIGVNSLIIAYANKNNLPLIQQVILNAKEIGTQIVVCSTEAECLHWLAANQCLSIRIPNELEDIIACPIIVILYFLYHYKLVPEAIIKQLDEALEVLDQREYFIQQGAENLALGLQTKIPAVLTSERFTAITSYFQLRLPNACDIRLNTYKANGLSETLLVVFYSTLHTEQEEKELRHLSNQIEAHSVGAADVYLRYGHSLVVQHLYAFLLINWTAFYLTNSEEIAL